MNSWILIWKFQKVYLQTLPNFLTKLTSTLHSKTMLKYEWESAESANVFDWKSQTHLLPLHFLSLYLNHQIMMAKTGNAGKK